MLNDTELGQVILAAEKLVVHMVLLSSSWRSPDNGARKSPAFMGGARPRSADLDDSQSTTKNAKAHIVHLSRQAFAVLKRAAARAICFYTARNQAIPGLHGCQASA